MQLLITTSKSFLALDARTGAAQVVERAGQIGFGSIALAPDAVYVGVRNYVPLSEYDPSRSDFWFRIYDRGLQLREELRAPFPLRDTHQICCDAGTLYAACSRDNMIAIYDGRSWERWYPDPEHKDADVNHFNTIYIAGRRLHLLAHNNDRDASEVFIFELPSRRLVERFALGRQAHNLWQDRGALHTCNSAHGLITSQSAWQVCSTGGFPRGAVVDRHRAYVGVSQIAQREEREDTSSEVQVYDRRWRLQHRIVLQDEGVICDLRAPGAADLCLPNGTGRPLRLGGTFPTRRFPLVAERRGLVGALRRRPV